MHFLFTRFDLQKQAVVACPIENINSFISCEIGPEKRAPWIQEASLNSKLHIQNQSTQISNTIHNEQ